MSRRDFLDHLALFQVLRSPMVSRMTSFNSHISSMVAKVFAEFGSSLGFPDSVAGIERALQNHWTEGHAGVIVS